MEKNELTDSASVESSKRSLIIVMGDSGEFDQRLDKECPRKIIDGMRSQGWTLKRTNNGIYWILTDVVKNLTKQFMHFVNPVIYIVLNYKSGSYLELLEKHYQLIQNDLINPVVNLRHDVENAPENYDVEVNNSVLIRKLPVKIMVVGVNFEDRKNYRMMKEKVLRWCVDKKAYLRGLDLPTLPELNYTELTKIDVF